MMRCLVCSEKARVVKGNRQVPLVWKCRECLFEWVDRDALTSHFEQPVYDAYPYNEHIDLWFKRMQTLYLKGFGARVQRTLGETALKRHAFLDIGCANGEYLRVARDLGFGTVSGVEIDEQAAQRAKQYGNVWRCIPDVDGKYDVVQIKNVLSNIIDFEGFLRESLECMKPDGYLYLDILNEQSLTALVRRTLLDGRKFGQANQRFGHLRPPYVINGFTPEAVRRMLFRVDLVPIHEETTYCGSAQVPYSSTTITKFAGFAGTLMGRGPMLVVEAAGALRKIG